MRHWTRRIALMTLFAALAVALAEPAAAFFPAGGGFDQFGVLRLIKWRLNDFDNNNDGDVRDGEGIEVLVENGPSGFTAEEILTVQRALDTWKAVPTSYAAFKIEGFTRDPLLSGLEPDFRNVIAMQVSAEIDDEDVVIDPADVIVPDLAFPVLGVTITLFTVDETVLDLAGEQIIVGAGTIIDADVLIESTSMRPDPVTGADALFDLEGTLTHELGHFLGMGHTPLNNLRASGILDPENPAVRLIENPAVHVTGADGEQRHVGCTPTMFPVYFEIQEGEEFRDGSRDLAPDDISMATWLYPRRNLSNFFDLNQEARSQRRAGSGFPSVPLVGGHVVAWADTDNNPDTPYIPVFSTMAGLYERLTNPQLEGRFELQYLWKQMEQPGVQGAVFNPAYVFTVSPLNFSGFSRQAPPGITAASVDGIQGPASAGAESRGDTDGYNNAFPSEVFQVVENLIDVENKDAGSPMVWSFERNTLVSLETGESLATVRPLDLPMFGDPNDVCPFNVISGGGSGTGTGTPENPAPNNPTDTKVAGSVLLERLRGFRDRVLLESPIGTALAGVYYESGPAVSDYLLRNANAFRAAKWAAGAFAWALEHLAMVAAIVGFGLAGAGAYRLRRRAVLGRAMRGLLPLVLAALAVGTSMPAGALITYVTDAELAAGASDIVVGKVTATQARWGRGGRIFTEVSLEIESTAKGTANQKSTITVNVIGGRIGDFQCSASESPVLAEGDEVVVHLNFRGVYGYVVHGGNRGALRVLSNPDGKRVVTPDAGALSGEAGKALSAKAAKQRLAKAAAGEPADGPFEVALDDYVAYLRAMVKESAAKP